MKKHKFVYAVSFLILLSITNLHVFGINGDINGSGRVDGKDLAFLARYYGENTNSINVSADLNSDGVINTNDYIILNENFGKTEMGGAAAWVSDVSKVYKIGVDIGEIRSTISGFPLTPIVNDINPDTGEAWVICSDSNLIYVISPFVPLEYNVISNSGYHYTYFVPGIKNVSLSPGTNAAICTLTNVYYWYDFPQNYNFTNDILRTHHKEFQGIYQPERVSIYNDKHLWARTTRSGYYYDYYKIYLSAPTVYNVQSGGVYHSSKQLNYNSDYYPQNNIDSLGNLCVKLGNKLQNISALSMGVTAGRDASEYILNFKLNSEDNSAWYSLNTELTLYHVSADLDEVVLMKNREEQFDVEAIDNNRKRVWGLVKLKSYPYDYNKIQVLNYLGNLDIEIENPDFNKCNSLRLFLPKIFSGYPIANVDADVTKGSYPLTVIFSATNSYDEDGSIVDYAWDFNGDGVFDLRGPDVTIVTNTYISPGKYSVMLKVTDDDGLENYNSDLVIGVGPLTVRPNASPTSGVASLNVTFSAEVVDGLGNGNMENYQWDFDDNGVFDYVSLTTPNTSYSYNKAGDYDARIKVLSKAGEIAEATVKVHVESSVPICYISANPYTITNAQEVKFYTSYSDSAGTIAMLSIDLDGDGVFEYNSSPNVSSGNRNVYNYFSQPGVYIIKAYVIDNEGNHSLTNEAMLNYEPTDYNLVISPQAVNAIGSVVCTTKPSIISISPEELTWTVKRYNYSNGVDETYLTTKKTETRLDITDLNIPGAYSVSLSYPDLRKDFAVYSPDDPVARFIATPENGLTPLEVNYDASASSSASGIVLYEWDFDSAYFYDDAEADYGIFYGDGRRTTEYAYEGSYSWLILTPGGLGTRYYQIPENNSIKISFYTFITNMSSVAAKLRVVYDNIYGSQTYLDYNLMAETNWNENIIIHNFSNARPGGQFLLRFYSTYKSMPVYIDNILVTDQNKNFGADESSSSPTTSHSFQEVGNYISLLRVTDANGNKCYANKAITVVSKPTISITKPEVGKSYGAVVNFTAQAENPNYITAYYWDYTGDGVADHVSTKLESQTYKYETGGTKTVNLYAELTDGSMLTSTVSFVVNLNTAPEIVGYYVSTLKSRVNFNLYSDLAVNFNDSDLDYIVWQYNDEAAVTNQALSNSKYITVAGIYTQKITVVALNGFSTSTQSVTRAMPYSCIFISATASQNPAGEGIPVELNGDLTYYGSAMVAESFAWDFNNDGIDDWTSTNSPLVTNTFMKSGSITSKVSVVTTNGIKDFDYLYLSIIKTPPTNLAQTTYFIVGTDYEQITNYANINDNGTLLNSKTNAYGTTYQFERSNYDGSYWVRFYEGYPLYDYMYYHFDKNMNVLGALTNTDEFTVLNIDLAPCIDNDGAWVLIQKSSWPYVGYLIKYNGNFQPEFSISNPPTRNTVMGICALPNDLVCIASYDSYGYELAIINSAGQVVDKALLPTSVYQINYNSACSNIWVNFNSSTYIYSLDLNFIGSVDKGGNTTMNINPVDGTVLVNPYGQITRYDGLGNLIKSSPTYSVFSDEISVDVSDGGVYSMRSSHVKKYDTAFAETKNYDTIPFSNYKIIAANGPYFDSAVKPTVFGNYSAVTKDASVEAIFTINASSPSGIASYEWDFDGDGIYDYYSETTGNTTNEYTQPGNHFPVCRIVDNNGIAIADTHLQPIDVTLSEANVNVQLFLAPANALTSPVTVAISTYADKGIVSYVRIYIDNVQVYSKYNPHNPNVFNYGFTLGGDYTIKAEITVDGTVYTVEKDIRINSVPPVAIINYTANPKGAPSQVTLDASSSYASGSSISFVQWDLNDDGYFDRYYENVTETITILYPTQSSANVKLRVTDNMGASSETNITIIVTNSGPVAVLSAGPPRGIAPFSSILTFNASDPDGNIVAYLLDADGNGTINHTASSAGSYQYNYTNSAGTYYPKLYAVDDMGATGIVSTTVIVLPAGSPIAFASATPASGPTPLSVTFVGECTNQTISLYEWDLDGDGTYEWNSTSNGIVNYTYDTKGKYTPKFRVTATNGFQDYVELIVNVGYFPIPQPRAMPLQAIAPQTVKFTADGIDPDGTILYFYWDINNSGTFVYYDPITDTPNSYNYTTPGIYKSLLIAQDDSGLQATGEISVVILSQEMPTVFATASPDIVNTGEVVSFNGYADDADGNIAHLKWVFGDGEEKSSTYGGEIHSYSSTGIYAAAFIATDNSGNSATATAFVTVLVTGWPRVTGSVTPNSGELPLETSFSIDGIPSSSPIVNYEIDFADGSSKFSVSSPDTVLHNYTEVGIYYPTLTVTDSNGRKSSIKLAVSVDGSMSIAFDEEKFDPTLAETVTANVFMPFDAKVTLNINNQYGVTKKTLWDDNPVAAGYVPVTWDGKDTLGNYVSDGTYYYVATYQRDGHTYVYDPSYDVPGLSSPSIDKSTVQNKPFTIYSDNPLMIGFTLNYRSEMSLYMAKNPTGVNTTPHLYNRVKTIYHHTPLAAGKQYARWDTTDDNGDIAVDPYSAADFFFYIWNWELPVNSVIVNSKPRISDITIEGEPNYYSAGLNPYRDSVTNELTITYSVSKPVSKVDVQIMNFNGQIVRTFIYNNVSQGSHSLKWDAKANDGYLTMPDSYKLAISAEDNEGNISDVVYDLFKLVY